MLRRIVSVLLSVPALALAVAILLAISCTPTWFPDSSGLLFVGSGGSVVRYTISTGKEQVVLPAGTLQPLSSIALRGDGKQFAWVTHRRDDERQTAQFHVYTVDGEMVHASERHQFTREKPKGKTFGPDLTLTRCYWSPDGKQLLGLIAEPQACIVYDLEARKFDVLADAVPLTNPFIPEPDMGIFFGISPVAPSDAGFLVLQATKEPAGSHVALVDWKEHKSRAIELPVEAIKAEHEQQKEGEQFGVWPAARWEMGTLAIPGQKGVLRIDTAARRAKYAADEDLTRLIDHARRQRAVVLGEFFGGNLLQVTNDRKLQVWRQDKKEALEIRTLDENEMPIASPSPNGRLLAIRLVGGVETSRLLLVDAQGRVLMESKQDFLPK